jgi:hypothetical protein
MLNRSLFIICILISGITTAQNYNRPVPTDHPPYEFVQNASISTSISHYLVSPFSIGSNSANLRNLTLINKDGFIDWYAPSSLFRFLDFKYHQQHQVFSYAQSGPQLSDAKFFVLDTLFNKIDSILPINGSTTDIHDFQILANGNYVIAGAKDSIMDLSAFVFDGTQGSDSTNVKGFIVQEFDANHSLIFEWNSNDHIHPIEFIDSYGYDSTSFDYVHGNAIEEDTDGNFLVSLRGLDAIYKIDKATGNTIWILGGKSNQFTFTNDNGFSGQHDIRRLANGNITLFNNDNNSTLSKTTRGIEYTLDLTNMTCTRVWEYIHTPPFYARAMGSCQTLPNNHRLMGYGFGFRPDPSFVHIDNNENIISELYFQDSTFTYRAFASELAFNLNNPTITCSDNGGGSATLTAPSGFTSYEWSTGETTQNITVINTGVYQVWLNYGIGMLGSEPLLINDLQNPCGQVKIDDLSISKKDKKIVFVSDLVGRQVTSPKRFQVYLVKYADGSAELIQWKESYRIYK